MFIETIALWTTLRRVPAIVSAPPVAAGGKSRTTESTRGLASIEAVDA
jgi:hypothetical protein